ncbi:MAG: hypothetical protein ABIH86_06850 [Planctomycetota bacterium]
MAGFATERIIATHPLGFASLAVSPDGQSACFDRDGKISVIDLATGKETEIGTGAHPAWTPSGTILVADNRRIVELTPGQRSTEPKVVVPQSLVWNGQPTAPSSNGKTMACTVEGLPYPGDKRRTVSAFALIESNVAKRLDIECYYGRAIVTSDNAFALLVSWGAIQGRLVILDMKTGAVLLDTPGRLPAVSPDGARVAYIGEHRLFIASIADLRRDPPVSPKDCVIGEASRRTARLSMNKPLWLDDETVLFENGGRVFAPDKGFAAKELGTFDGLSSRGIPSWDLNRGTRDIIFEREKPDGTFELCVATMD